MKTLLYEVILRDPITKAIYPEEFVGLRSIVGVTPGGRFEIEVRVNFEAIPSKNDLLPQTVEIEVTVNGQANPWVFDCTAQIPVCTFVGFPDSHGQVTPYVVPATLPTLVPGDSAHAGTDGHDDDQEWVDELFTVQVNATVIYSYVETTNVQDDPIPSDFFTFPAQTLYYHSPGTMTTLSAHYTKQNRSSAKALDHALTAAISAAAYDDFYADNYDPNDDSDNDDNDDDDEDDDGDYDSDDDSEVYEVDAHGNRKHNHNNSNGDDDDDSANEDDWWGADAQPQATKTIQQQKDRHQQLVQQHQRRQTPAGTGAGSSSSSSGAAAVVAAVTAIASTVAAKRGYGAITQDSSDSEGGGGLPPAKRATSASSVVSGLPVLPAPALVPAPTAPVLPTITSTFSHRLPMADSDSEAD